jgi:integrase
VDAGTPGRGLEVRGPYTMRHTFATWGIESGVQLWYLAQVMGTSFRELEDTYARWLTRTDEQLRAAFDTYDAAGSSSGPRRKRETHDP